MSSHSLAGAAHALLLLEHDLLQRFGKLSKDAPIAEELAEPLQAIRGAAQELTVEARAHQDPEALPEALARQLALLDAVPPPDADASARAAWERGLQEAYDLLTRQVIAWGVDLSMHRPPNRARSVMHITTAALCLVLVEYVLTPTGMIVAAALGAAGCWAMEIGRIFSKRLNLFLLRFMAAVAHPHERREVNSATWYTTALLILALLFAPKFCTVALVVLGLADPAAAFVGRRWGRIGLINGRSLEGSAAFLLVGATAAFAALSIWHPEVTLGLAILIALGAAFAAAITELSSRRLDDNLTIPLAAAGGAWLVSVIV